MALFINVSTFSAHVLLICDSSVLIIADPFHSEPSPLDPGKPVVDIPWKAWRRMKMMMEKMLMLLNMQMLMDVLRVVMLLLMRLNILNVFMLMSVFTFLGFISYA